MPKGPGRATHAIGVRITAEQFSWLRRQAGTSSAVIRRLLDREVVGADSGKEPASAAEVWALTAAVTRLVERLEALAPVVEVEAAPVAVEPPLLRPAPPVPMEASVVPEVPKPLSVVQRWVAEGHGRDRLFTLDQARELTDEELDLDLARRGRSREQFDAAVGGMVAEWLEGRGQAPRGDDPAQIMEITEAMACELRAALASGEAEAVPVP